MSDIEREAFEKWFGSRVWPTTMQPSAGDKARMFISWQAARAQQGEAEPVAHQWRRKAAAGEWNLCDPDSLEYYRRNENHEVRELFAAQPPAVVGLVPEGWTIKREDLDQITIEADGLGYYESRNNATRVADIMLYALANDLLTAAPSPEQSKPRNRYGVDAPYFYGKLSLVLRDLENYTPDELARALARLVVVADKDVLAEPEFTPEQGQTTLKKVVELVKLIANDLQHGFVICPECSHQSDFETDPLDCADWANEALNLLTGEVPAESAFDAFIKRKQAEAIEGVNDSLRNEINNIPGTVLSRKERYLLDGVLRHVKQYAQRLRGEVDDD